MKQRSLAKVPEYPSTKYAEVAAKVCPIAHHACHQPQIAPASDDLEEAHCAKSIQEQDLFQKFHDEDR